MTERRLVSKLNMSVWSNSRAMSSAVWPPTVMEESAPASSRWLTAVLCPVHNHQKR